MTKEFETEMLDAYLKKLEKKIKLAKKEKEKLQNEI